MGEDADKDERELGRLRSEVAAQPRDINDLDDREHRQESVIARLRKEAAVREGDFAVLRERLEAAEHELEDLRAIRDALTPPELPKRPGSELAAAFLPASPERVSGDGAVAPFSDDPCRLLSWANTALIERAGITSEFVTAACVTYLPGERLLRWACAGHPPALWLDDGRELSAPTQGTALGIRADAGCAEGSLRSTAGAAVLLYTDGLTEARHDGELFGLDRVSAALRGLHRPSPTEAVAILRSRVADFAYGTLTDDLCLLAARIN